MKKTTVKKVNRVSTPVKKMTETKIKEYLEQHDHEDVSVVMEDFDGDEDNEGLSTTISSELDGDNEEYEVGFIVKEYPCCCGMREIGEITMFTEEIIPTELYRDLLTKMLRRVIKAVTNEAVGSKIGLSFSVPINEEINYQIFIDAAIKVGFKEVGEFVNKNSGNTLKHFINL